MPPAQSLVPGDGWVSDESSFYGDDETKEALEGRCEASDSTQYWATHEKLVQTIAFKARAASSSANANPERAAAEDSKELAYLHEGNLLWYQPTETVVEFLRRCPPHTTFLEESGIDWFWIDNPHKAAHPKEHPNVQTFTDAGDNLLDEYRNKRNELEKKNPGMPKGVITRKLSNDREKLKQKLAELARETNVVCGKWLVFPPHDDVPRFWKQVCHAVLENRLGPTAKVATRSIAKADPYGLICIYTKDCFDVDDVRRVLLALVDMGLVSDREDARGIWYKMDAYTYLNLNSGNEFNLPASLYSSKDMLKDGRRAAKRKADEMQSPKPKTKQRSIADMFR